VLASFFRRAELARLSVSEAERGKKREGRSSGASSALQVAGRKSIACARKFFVEPSLLG